MSGREGGAFSFKKPNTGTDITGMAVFPGLTELFLHLTSSPYNLPSLQGNPALSAELFLQLVALQPSAENYARLSKQYTDMTYSRGMTGMPRDQMAELNLKALGIAQQAVALDPSVVNGHIALCVSRGRLALVSENRAKIQLAKEAADDAATALRLDPRSDFAHHLMGRWVP